MSRRAYHDPLHGAIVLDRQDPAEALAIDLIETAAFQRLRRIRQLGTAFLTFHGAEGSRFTHSIGVLYLARQALDQLRRDHPGLESHRGVLFAAALLHDIGHGPLSHSGEEMYGLRHEDWSGRLIQEHPPLRDLLEAYAPGTAQAVANLVMRGQYSNRSIKALVSSQLDCDRLDYLLRDSYTTGTSYGQLDLERILAAFIVAPDGSLAIHPKGLSAVEHYLVVRRLMYRTVYNHRLNVVGNWLLERIIALARQRQSGQLWADTVMAHWLWAPEQLGISDFLANDDLRTGYHLQRWHQEAGGGLAELCGRFLERRLLKATDVSQLSNTDQLAVLARARRLAATAGLDPELSCGLRQRRIRGYHPYAGGLRLWDGQRLAALEHHSDLVATLSEPQQMAWVLHPREITGALRKDLKQDRLSAQIPAP